MTPRPQRVRCWMCSWNEDGAIPEASGSESPRLAYPLDSMSMPVAKSSVMVLV